MLVESVPNVSEGRRLDVVDRMAEAISSVRGVSLLDRTSDASHNRSVFTMAGEDGPVTAALEKLVETAVHEIDMDVHEGEHPRIGAVDVIPFIPLGDTSIDACIELARDFGKRIARRVRESGGGLPRVQANGFEVREPERGHPLRAQVSMNLLDFTVTPLWLVWDTVRDLAAEDGVEPAESELIGLAPLASFLAVADRADADPALPVEGRLRAAASYLRLRDFSPMQALELRLEEALRSVPSSAGGSPTTGERDPRRTGA